MRSRLLLPFSCPFRFVVVVSRHAEVSPCPRRDSDSLTAKRDRYKVNHMCIRPRFAALVCASVFLVTVLGRAQAAMQVLQKHVRPAVASGSAAPVGFLPSTRCLNLVIHLPVRNHDELVSLIDRLSDPGSPDYRHWLSVAEFTKRFGRTETEYEKVADFVEANGFVVTYKSPNRLMLVVRGSVAQIERAFNVKMRTYRHPVENRIFYSPDREPSLALDVPVSHISGLNNYSYPHPGAESRSAELGSHNPAESQAPTGTGSGPNSSFLGSDMRAAYNMGSNTGAGQTVALAEFSGYTASDVSLYFSNIGQTNNVSIDNIVVDGGSATSWSDANDEGEVCLDIEQAVSVAPGMDQLRVYIGPTSFGTGADGYIFSKMATDNVAKQLSNSWWWSPDDPATDNPYFEEMATQGQTLFNISGDYGAYTGNDANDMGYPAEDTHLTAVGGTELTTNGAGGTWQSEVAWNDDSHASGGGPADDGTKYFAIPSWQMPVINSSNDGSTTLRNSPDVALQADFDNYICYDDGECSTDWGGTSFAAPRWAAWLALVNQQVVADGQTAGLGSINPTLYSIGRSARYDGDFHDITSGDNDSNGQSKFYYAVIGYDLVTGWGSMNGQPLMAALTSAIAHNTWRSGAPMPTAVQRAAVGVLGGRIYAIGGENDTGSFVTDNQIYDPATNTWSTGTPLPIATSSGCAAVVKNVLYYIGGFIGHADSDVTGAVWAYDPKTQTWSSVGVKAPKPTAEEGATCVVENDIVYVSGGYNGDFLRTNEAYNPATNKWTSEEPLLLQEDQAIAGLVGTTIIVTDGSDNIYTGYTQGYEAATNSWKAYNSDPTARQDTCGGTIDSRLYSAGGWNGGSGSLTLTESFTPSTNAWNALAPMPLGTNTGGSTVYKGQLYCFGGEVGNNSGVVGNVQIYQP
jgi:N-acetylneuraminic acid mutarotase